VDSKDFSSRYQSLTERVSAAARKSGRSASDVRVVVVTKNSPAEILQTVIDAGVHDVGENRVQEIEAKAPLLTGSFDMHLIGHLQTNKVNKVVPLVSWIQSIDSIRLADKVNSAAESCHKKIKVLLQVKTSPEETKSGCSPDECIELAAHVASCSNLDFRGLMTIGPLDAGEAQTRASFALLRSLAGQCRTICDNPELSMGMSSDFEWAIEEGATIIRVGTMLLGNRVYPTR
jgi:hypothetical protein